MTTTLVKAKVGEEYSLVKVSPLMAHSSKDASTHTFSLDATSQALPDAILLLQYLSGNTDLLPRQLKAADITGEGVIDTADVIIIMQRCMPK